MKRLLVLAFLTLNVLYVSAQELTPVFGPFINVTPNNLWASTRPLIALTNDSVPIVTWTRPGAPSGRMYVALWNGSGFNTPTQIALSIDIFSSQEEGGDIAARGDTVYIVFFSTSSVCYCIHSYDAGLTWSDSVRVNHQVAREAFTPNVEIDRNGNPVVVFESTDLMSQVNPAQMICRSYDGGNSFNNETSANATINGQPCECCPPELLIRDSMTYVIYRNNESNIRNIVMSVSSDSGSTFLLYSDVDQTNWLLTSCPTAGADAAFYRDSVLLFWKSSNQLWYGCGHAQNGGAGPDNLLEPSLSASVIQRHQVVDAVGDTVVFIWDDRRTFNTDCYIAITGGGPQQISTAFVVNDTAGLADVGSQQCPRAIIQGNKVHIVYQDLPAGMVMYRVATIGGPVGIPEPTPELLPEIYPMPATMSFTISNVDGKFSVEIFAMNGALVSSQTGITSGEPISCNELATGTYTVVVKTAAGVKTTLPLIKQ